MIEGTLAVSWGRYGGFYLHARRFCLGWIALTYVPVEIDDLMRGYVETLVREELSDNRPI